MPPSARTRAHPEHRRFARRRVMEPLHIVGFVLFTSSGLRGDASSAFLRLSDLFMFALGIDIMLRADKAIQNIVRICSPPGVDGATSLVDSSCFKHPSRPPQLPFCYIIAPPRRTRPIQKHRRFGLRRRR